MRESYSYTMCNCWTLNVENYDACHILVDNRSLADVLYYIALLKIGISPDWMAWVDSFLVGFIGDVIQIEGMVTLTMRMGCYPLWSISQVHFLVVWVPSTYNAILGWPGLNAFQMIMSIYYQKVKFSTMLEVRKIYRDKSLACHYYYIELYGAEAPSAYLVEGLDTRDDLAKQWVKDLVTILVFRLILSSLISPQSFNFFVELIFNQVDILFKAIQSFKIMKNQVDISKSGIVIYKYNKIIYTMSSFNTHWTTDIWMDSLDSQPCSFFKWFLSYFSARQYS